MTKIFKLKHTHTHTHTPWLTCALGYLAQTSLRRQVCWVLTNLLRVRGARLPGKQRAQCAEAFLVLVSSLHPEVQGTPRMKQLIS